MHPIGSLSESGETAQYGMMRRMRNYASRIVAYSYMAAAVLVALALVLYFAGAGEDTAGTVVFLAIIAAAIGALTQEGTRKSIDK
jgi:hypothetical protein